MIKVLFYKHLEGLVAHRPVKQFVISIKLDDLNGVLALYMSSSSNVRHVWLGLKVEACIQV